MAYQANGTQPSGKGPPEWFTGTVPIDPLFKASDPARVSGASFTFEPAARTAWHTHPLGQTIVTAGSGLAQREGGPIEQIQPGDVVWFRPGEKHWHGATPTIAMTHIAIAEALDGKVVDGWNTSATRSIAPDRGEPAPPRAGCRARQEVDAPAKGRAIRNLFEPQFCPFDRVTEQPPSHRSERCWGGIRSGCCACAVSGRAAAEAPMRHSKREYSTSVW
jgi:quercetin dioxygenase-like cupin family protein